MTGRTGVVLAGGHSRRFGPEEKVLAELDGDPLVARVIDRVATVGEEVIVSSPGPGRPVRTGSFVDAERRQGPRY